MTSVSSGSALEARRQGSQDDCSARVAVLVVSCDKYQHRWARVHAMFSALHWTSYWIVTGDPNAATDFKVLSGSSEHRLVVKSEDTYEALPSKMVRVCQAFAHDPVFTGYDAMWKMDDDVSVQAHFSLPVLESVLDGLDYAGAAVQFDKGNRSWHLSKCSDHRCKWNNLPYNGSYVPWAKGGFSYCLSKRAARLVAGVIKEDGSTWSETLLNREIYEDLAIAKLLLKYDIHPVEIAYIALHMKWNVYGDTG